MALSFACLGCGHPRRPVIVPPPALNFTRGDVRVPGFFRLAQSDESRTRLRSGEVLIATADSLKIDTPLPAGDGELQHWVGAIFVPEMTIQEALPRLKDYENRKLYMQPEIVESQVISRQGDDFHVRLRLHESLLISGDFDVFLRIAYQMPGKDRLLIKSQSERITVVADGAASTKRGFLWKLNHEWRIAEGDGGLYVECEAVVLSQRPPTMFQWIAEPLISQAARKALTGSLLATRNLIRGHLTAAH